MQEFLCPCRNTYKLEIIIKRGGITMKKFLSLLVAMSMIAMILAGCGQSGQTTKPETPTETRQEETQTPEPEKEAPKIIIGLSTDEGGLNDKSFNQSADTGIKRAQAEFGIEYKAIESKSKDDYESNFDALVSEGCQLVFGVGFQMQPAVQNIAAKYPDTNFAIIDAEVDLPNVQSILFKEHEGSFLMGVIAGKMSKTGKVGFIGGRDGDVIQRFESGFTAGVLSVNPEAGKGLQSKDGEAYGVMVRYADDFADAAKGYEAAKQLYSAGCDVIYHAAGGVGLGLFKAAKELRDDGKDVWAIGVDMDQAVTVPEYASVLLSSMMKGVDAATYTATKEIVEGTFKGGKVTTLGLNEGGVGIAPSTNVNTPQEVIDLVKQYEEAIKAGKIAVPATRAEASKFTPVPLQ